MKRITIAVLAALACGSAAAVNYLGPPLTAGNPSGPVFGSPLPTQGGIPGKPSGPVFGSPLPTQGGIPGPRMGPMGGPSLVPPTTNQGGRPSLGPPTPPSSPSPPRLR